jgi:asparagine synthase (glutamine-hydrolysing)
MPGISFACDRLNKSKQVARDSFEELRHFNNYHCKEYLADAAFFVGISGYVEYPSHLYEDEHVVVLLEGCIYNCTREALDDRLRDLSKLLLEEPLSEIRVRSWLFSVDGDFLIFCHLKSRDMVCILNDLFGRLPFYYANMDGLFLGSREWRFVVRQLPEPRCDKMGLALFLLFTFTIGKRTLWEGVKALEGGSVLRIECNNAASELTRVCEFNFQELEESGGHSFDIDELAALFRKAAANRVGNSGLNVIGLSGGLDSRAVAAALGNHPLIGVSRLSPNGKERRDVRVAKIVASAQENMKWEVIEAKAATSDDFLNLLNMKGGMNSLGMSFNLPFLNEVRERYGSGIRYFTGDGGDRVKPHFSCRASLGSIEGLRDYVIASFAATSLKAVTEFTACSEDEVCREVQEYLLACPETSLKHKYMHFQIYESAFKWVFEGEDRNRFYFWSVTPFYGTQFFLRLMSIPDQKKHFYRLYRKFLVSLSGTLARIETENWGMSIKSPLLTPRLYLGSMLSHMPAAIRALMKRRVSRRHEVTAVDAETYKCMQGLVNSQETAVVLKDYFALPAIQALLTRAERPSMALGHALFTVMTAVEAVHRREVTFGDVVERPCL